MPLSSRSTLMIYAVTGLMCCIAPGCSNSNHLDTAPVSGLITYDGQPLKGGAVIFQSEKGRGSTGIIKDDGTYSMKTYTDDDGAIIGKNKVAVVPKTASTVVIEEEGPVKNNPYSNFPTNSMIPTTSRIEFTVESDKANQFDIKLLSRERQN